MPRAGLTTDVVVAGAANLADEIGYDRLTLTALAHRLGVAIPSLYKHIGGLDELRRGVALVAIRELGGVLDVASRSAEARGDDRLRAVATAFRAYALAHPGRYAATVRAAPPGDGALAEASAAALQPALEVLAGRGLAGTDAIDGARTVRAALHGFVALEEAGGFGLPRDVDRSFDALVDTINRGLPDRGRRVS